MALPLLLALCPTAAGKSDSEVFADDLEQCIRTHAAAAAESFPSWAHSCLPPTEKIDKQAEVYFTTLNPIRERYGYTATLWCAFCKLHKYPSNIAAHTRRLSSVWLNGVCVSALPT